MSSPLFLKHIHLYRNRQGWNLYDPVLTSLTTIQNLQQPKKNPGIHEINKNNVEVKFKYKNNWLFLLYNVLMYISYDIDDVTVCQ